MMLTGDRIDLITYEYDAALARAEDATIARINAALDKAAKELEARLIKAYEKYKGIEGVLPRDRLLLIRQEIDAYRALLKPSDEAKIQEDFELLLSRGSLSGIDMATELVKAAQGSAADLAAVPIEAIRFQAQDATKRLYRWTAEFQNSISGLIEYNLAIGSGSRKVATQLRHQLGIAKGRADAIARTEMLSSFDAATRSTYQRNEIAYVQRVAAGADGRVCAYCAARDGYVYRLEEAVAVLHPRCRCKLIPWKPEWAKLGLLDSAWVEKHAADVQADTIARGIKPNTGIAPFERMNNVKAPKPFWRPGEPLPETTAKPTRKKPTPPIQSPPQTARRMPERHAIALSKQWKGDAVDQALDLLINPGASERVQRLRDFVNKHDVQAIFYNKDQADRFQRERIRKELRSFKDSWTASGEEEEYTGSPGEGLGYTLKNINHIVVGSHGRRGGQKVDAATLNAITQNTLRLSNAGTPAYSSASHTIKQSDTEAFITYLHEMGHQVHYKASLARPPKDAEPPITVYGGTNLQEYFAESFALWMIDAEEFAKYSPNTARWISDTLDKAIAAPKSESRKESAKKDD